VIRGLDDELFCKAPAAAGYARSLGSVHILTGYRLDEARGGRDSVAVSRLDHYPT
jgi:hypothetical protein